MQSSLLRPIVGVLRLRGRTGSTLDCLGLRFITWSAGRRYNAESRGPYIFPPLTKSNRTVYYKAVSYKSSYSCVASEVPLLGLTIGQVLDDSAEKYGDREAVVSCHQNIRKTYSEFKQDADNLAAGFLALGLKKGDRLGIWSPNNYEWFLTQMAASKAGLILVLVNPAYQVNELEYCLKKVEMSALILAEHFKTQDYYKTLASVIENIADSKPGQVKSSRLPNLKTVIMLSDKSYGGTYKFDEVFKASGNKELEELKYLEKKIQFDDPVNIQFTSGTTGSPKGATLSHHNIVNNGLLVGRRMGYHLEVERINIPVPLYHCFGCVIGTLSSVIHGGCAVLPAPSFNATSTAEAVQAEKCTTLYGTPTMFIDILNLPDLDKYNFSSLKKGIMAGSICPEEILKACSSKLNIKEISVAYGSTETSPVTTFTPPKDSFEKRTSTVGTALDYTEIKIIDNNGEVVPVGTPGELLARGYAVMLGYWNDIDKTKEVITGDRWYKSGDQSVMDEQGYIQIVGRLKDLIIRGGENIYPKEVEEYLYKHPKIADVQVIGIPDQRLGEEVCAWIKLKSEQNLDEEEVKSFCKGKIAHFKIPRYIFFMDDFPKTVTGKVQKFIMREQTVKKLKLKG